jgi:hypothetical protein
LKYYFFGESDFVPYIRGQAGLSFSKFTTIVIDNSVGKFRELSYDPSLMVGAGAGAFFYTTDYSGLFLEVNYYQAFSEEAKGTFQETEYRFGENIGLLDIHAGIHVFFGSE